VAIMNKKDLYWC